ncbi:helix-turn-helix domain-containing protein [Fusobacterium polymorphum]|uniref:helix-turn-helix domain-containing protein n=1 Tax=Fusobacterium nucleatum subsp. polymorphum TaxID=76857 RepID=UPI0030CE02CA
MAEIKDRIVSLRNEKNITQSQLAEELDISPSAIGMYEQGRRKPSYELLEEICDYFNVDMDYLMGRSDIKNRYQAGLKYEWEDKKEEKNIFSQLTKEELAKLEKFNNMSTVMFMNEGNDISDKDKETLATAYAEVLISQRKK